VNILEMQNSIFEFLKNSTSTHFNVSVKSEVSYLYGCDSEILEQMITELFQNVIQYADPKYDIESNASCENNMFILTIRNHYRDSYRMKTSHIKPFYQAHNAKDMNGSGLGLYIVKEWASRQNGSLVVNGSSNIFEVTLKIPVPKLT
jgi:signal transduction histidine kinase